MGKPLFGSSRSRHCLTWPDPDMRTFISSPALTFVYVLAFGITMYEMWTRREAYGDEDELMSILAAVADPGLQPPMRPWGDPSSMPSDMPPDFASLILRTTDNDPDLRPDFDAIGEALKLLDLAVTGPGGGTHGMSGSVASSSVQFPPRMASALRSGRVVEPESFDDTSIFVATIVAFEELALRMSKAETDDMIDRLYSSFDALASAYGLFRIATASADTCAWLRCFILSEPVFTLRIFSPFSPSRVFTFL